MSRYVCACCTRSFPLVTPRWRCDCGSHLDITPARGLTPRAILTDRNSLWRYQAALPLDGPPSVTLGEGWTPLIEGMWDGQMIRFKLEFCSASGSFKDRGIAVMVDYLKRCGVTSVVEDSSGNGGAALATYAAAAGLDCRILVPRSASGTKVIQIAAAGAEPVLISGTRQDVADAALRQAEKRFYASHNWQALFVEGVKTLGYELWEMLGFRAPDNVVMPVGAGSALLGCWRAFNELHASGELERLPRLFAVQAANCAPLHHAYHAGGYELPEISAVPTIAEGIAITRPVRFAEALQALRRTGGGSVAVSEDAIVVALRALARQGLLVEPTAAAAAAGLSRLIADRIVTPGQTTVLVLTGSGLKSADTIARVLGIG